jgi:hypothetical protein
VFKSTNIESSIEYQWFQNGRRIDETNILNIEKVCNHLIFYKLNMAKYNGSYTCSAILKNGTRINSTESFNISVIKSKKN